MKNGCNGTLMWLCEPRGNMILMGHSCDFVNPEEKKVLMEHSCDLVNLEEIWSSWDTLVTLWTQRKNGLNGTLLWLCEPRGNMVLMGHSCDFVNPEEIWSLIFYNLKYVLNVAFAWFLLTKRKLILSWDTLFSYFSFLTLLDI